MKKSAEAKEKWPKKDRIHALLARLEAAEKMAEAVQCPDCPNLGWYPGGDGQQQCQFCYEHPQSRFNVWNTWRKAAGKS